MREGIRDCKMEECRGENLGEWIATKGLAETPKETAA